MNNLFSASKYCYNAAIVPTTEQARYFCQDVVFEIWQEIRMLNAVSVEINIGFALIRPKPLV